MILEEKKDLTKKVEANAEFAEKLEEITPSATVKKEVPESVVPKTEKPTETKPVEVAVEKPIVAKEPAKVEPGVQKVEINKPETIETKSTPEPVKEKIDIEAKTDEASQALQTMQDKRLDEHLQEIKDAEKMTNAQEALGKTEEIFGPK